MRIKKIIGQYRRDFTAMYECESCGVEEKSRGYDDANFHKNVIPLMPCGACGAVSPAEYRPLTTKYAEGEVV